MSLDDDTPRRLRSPPFPFIPLGKVVDRARQLYPKALHHAVGLNILAEAWSYGKKSSGLVQTAAALTQFGLMVVEGSGERRKYQLTKEAIRILQDADPDSEKRMELLKRAALAPKVHQELWAKFTTGIVSDSVIRNYLMFDRAEADESPFSMEAANSLINVYKSSISFANIDAGDVPSEFLCQSTEEMETKPIADSQRQEYIRRVETPERLTRPASKAGMKERCFFAERGRRGPAMACATFS